MGSIAWIRHPDGIGLKSNCPRPSQGARNRGFLPLPTPGQSSSAAGPRVNGGTVHVAPAAKAALVGTHRRRRCSSRRRRAAAGAGQPVHRDDERQHAVRHERGWPGLQRLFPARRRRDLPGCERTRDPGTWHLDKDGDVCVAWQNPADRQEGCFRVTVDGGNVSWEGKAGSGRAVLRGGVSNMLLKPMVQ